MIKFLKSLEECLGEWNNQDETYLIPNIINKTEQRTHPLTENYNGQIS